MSFIDFKRCKKCEKIFDMGTNLDICPECRKKEKERMEDE